MEHEAPDRDSTVEQLRAKARLVQANLDRLLEEIQQLFEQIQQIAEISEGREKQSPLPEWNP